MAIKKIKKTTTKRKETPRPIESSLELEAKRAEFQEVASGKAPLKTDEPVVIADTRRQPLRRLVMAIIIACAVIAIGSVSAWAYFWNNSADKIVFDAMNNAAKAPSVQYDGSVSLLQNPTPQMNFKGQYTDGIGQFDATVDTPLPGSLARFNASVITSQNAVYVKAGQLSKFIDQGAPQAMRTQFGPYLPLVQQQVDGKWLRISPDNLAMIEPLTHVSQCMVDVLQRLTTDKTAMKTLFGIYRQAPFFSIVETTRSSEAIGKYSLVVNGDQFSAFLPKLVHSQFYGSLAGCHIDTQSVSAAKTSGFKVVLTINKTNRQLTDISIDTGDSFVSGVSIQPTFNDQPAAKMPSNATDFNTIKQQAILQSLPDVFKQLR